MNNARHQAGFTLIELAVAIFIIALLLGSLLVPLATQVESRQISETQKTMEEIRDALYGFAATNGYLPCPDLQTLPNGHDGAEDFDGAGVCTAPSVTSAGTTLYSGNLPWATLGLGNQDAWGNRFRYAVVSGYALRTAPFSLTTTGGLRVCQAALCPLAPPSLTTTAVAVVISHGKNGYSAYNALTNTQNTLAISADEIENANNNRDAVSRTQSNVAATEFDDIVIWLPKFNLNNRMVTAGRLP